MEKLNEVTNIYDIKEIEKLKKLESFGMGKENKGYLYILKYKTNDNLDTIKIGVSIDPYKRISNLSRTTKNYGFAKITKFAIIAPHLNYYKSERKMHKYYEEKRKIGCEVFNVPFEDACNKAKDLLFKEKIPILDYYDIEYKFYQPTPLCDCINLKTKTMIEISKNCGNMSLSIFMAIFSHYNKLLKYSCVSYNILANETKMSRNTICKYAKKLNDSGYLIIKSGKFNKEDMQNSSNAYFLSKKIIKDNSL